MRDPSWGRHWHALSVEEQERQATLAGEVDALLIRNGYPPGQTDSFWNSTIPAWLGLEGRTPRQAWQDDDCELVWSILEECYTQTAASIERLRNNPEKMAELHRQVAESRRADEA